jgi:hypothetical protein
VGAGVGPDLLGGDDVAVGGARVRRERVAGVEAVRPSEGESAYPTEAGPGRSEVSAMKVGTA